MSRAVSVCLQWPTLGPYHAARIHALVDHWSDQDCRVCVIETAATDGTYRWDSVDRSTFEVSTLFPGRNFDQLVPNEITAAMRHTLSALSPDVVVTNSYAHADARAALAWAVANRRHAILTTDSQYAGHKRMFWREWAKRQIVSLYDAAVVAGTRHVEYVTRSLGIDPAVVYTGLDVVDNDFFERGAGDVHQSTTSPKPGIPTSPYFLFCGRLSPEKNLRRLFEAYAVYRSRSRSPWPLVVVGDGELRRELETFADQSEAIVFAGRQPYADLPRYYRGAGALVLPSLRDTWGLVVNEAMASGLPVLVSSACGCVDDLVEEGANGFTFDPTDGSAIAGQLVHMASLSDEARQRLGDRSRTIIAGWPVSRFATAIDMAVESAMAEAPRRSLPGRIALVAANRLIPGIQS